MVISQWKRKKWFEFDSKVRDRARVRDRFRARVMVRARENLYEK